MIQNHFITLSIIFSPCESFYRPPNHFIHKVEDLKLSSVRIFLIHRRKSIEGIASLKAKSDGDITSSSLFLHKSDIVFRFSVVPPVAFHFQNNRNNEEKP